jgi:hypothetical protein
VSHAVYAAHAALCTILKTALAGLRCLAGRGSGQEGLLPSWQPARKKGCGEAGQRSVHLTCSLIWFSWQSIIALPGNPSLRRQRVREIFISYCVLLNSQRTLTGGGGCFAALGSRFGRRSPAAAAQQALPCLGGEADAATLTWRARSPPPCPGGLVQWRSWMLPASTSWPPSLAARSTFTAKR